jgi:hypothetical protein
MFIVFCFIGNLPSYIKETVHQARCFFEGDIYLITSQIDSVYLNDIKKYNVNIVKYEDVVSLEFLEIAQKNIHKFQYIHQLAGREQLFLRSFERFFVLQNLMKQKNLEDCLFLELDILIYDEPTKWVSSFSESELCYMFDNYERFCSGIMYIKNFKSITGLLEEMLNFISNSNSFMNEMTVLSLFYDKNKQNVQILPTYWCEPGMPFETHLNYSKYNDTIFDSAAMGGYLFGMDTIHTNFKIVKYQKSKWAYIDATKNVFKWVKDDKDRQRPYIWTGEKWILINNLHIHAKNLNEALSLPIEYN